MKASTLRDMLDEAIRVDGDLDVRLSNDPCMPIHRSAKLGAVEVSLIDSDRYGGKTLLLVPDEESC